MVRGSASSSLTRAGALAEAADHAAERLEELGQVLEQVDAGDPPQDREHHRGAAAEDLHPDPGRAHEHLERAALDELQSAGSAPRGSRARCATAACRGRAGRSGPRRGSRTASPSPCTPASRRARSRAAGRSGSRGSGRGSPRRARACGRPRRTSAFASSIIAQSSPPPGSTPASANSAGSTWRSALPSSGRPSESARRFAGSIVSTATFLPRAAIPAAIAAEVVVLPTPPEPAQMQTRLPSSSSATRGHQATSRSASALDLPRPRARARTGTAASSPAPRQSPPGGRAARAGTRARRLSRERRAAGRRARRRSPSGSAAAIRSVSALGEALRVEAVAEDPVDVDADLVARSRSSIAVSLTGISSGSATIATPVRLRSSG